MASIIISILIFIVSILLMTIVLIQNSKGGGLAAGFSSSNQIVGVQRTTDFLEKGTWYLAGALLVLCLLSTAFNDASGTVRQETSELENVLPVSAPVMPAEGAPLPGE